MERRSARDDQRFEQRLGRLRLLVSRILAPCISIFTRADDFHAYAIRHALAARGVRCQIVETDRLALHGGMSWSTSGEVGAATICDVDDQPVAVADLDLLWWRRLTGEPRLPESLRDEAARDLVAQGLPGDTYRSGGNRVPRGVAQPP